MARKKIFITHSWTDVGVNVQTKAVAHKLSESFEVLYFSQARIGSPEIKVNDRLRVIEWPNKRPNTLKDFLFVSKQILKEKPEIVICHFGGTGAMLLAAWLLRVKHRICWLHTLSGQYLVDLGNKNVALKIVNQRKKLYKLATHAVVLNEFGKVDAREAYKIPISKIVKIFNGILPIQASQHNQELKCIRYIGRLDKSKGVDIVLAVFIELFKVRKDIRLDLAGKGSETDHLLQQIKDYQLDDVVRYHGYFTDYKESRNFISNAYCLLVPSRIDNFPTVILEALSAGVPVIASNVGGIPEMIEDGESGFLVENENIRRFTEVVEALVADTELRSRISKNAAISFKSNFSMTNHVNVVNDFITGIANPVSV